MPNHVILVTLLVNVFLSNNSGFLSNHTCIFIIIIFLYNYVIHCIQFLLMSYLRNMSLIVHWTVLDSFENQHCWKGFHSMSGNKYINKLYFPHVKWNCSFQCPALVSTTSFKTELKKILSLQKECPSYITWIRCERYDDCQMNILGQFSMKIMLQ